MDLEHPYAVAALGQRDPPAVSKSCDIPTELLRADSLWASGKASDAIQLLDDLEGSERLSSEQYRHLASGLRALVKGDLDAAYQAYFDAAAVGPDVFAGERAVNIAFWMACAGKMLAAGCLLGGVVEKQPFAGGVLAFAQHMVGNSALAEQTAKTAIAKGFDDPWTLHAVAHSMYSLGRSGECAQWLIQHREKLASCSAFMKTHMEFHLALCLIDLGDVKALAELLEGPLWASLSATEREDFWCATGVLNALWKAELRGLKVHGAVVHVASALQQLQSADVEKSKVFSLVMLRWHDDSPLWLAKIQAVNHTVFSAVANAIQYAYNGNDWAAAASALLPVVDRLPELGASPEQREVIEEFLAVALVRSGSPVRDWLEKNRRPGIAWYDQLRLQAEEGVSKRPRTSE